jgi:extracellular factor (EF) 3-hydroxypalmitic acid methyl ester biosynthesis protein
MVHPMQEMGNTFNGNGNGNGHGTHSLVRPLLKRMAPTQTAGSLCTVKESLMAFQTSGGVKLTGIPTYVTRHTAAFELYNPDAALRLSEVLAPCEIIFQSRTIYSGSATLRTVVHVGSKIVCEATLKEEDWVDLNLTLSPQKDDEVASEFNKFLMEWQKSYKVLPEFKEAVSDIKMFLIDLRLWLDQIELGIASSPELDRVQLERGIIEKLAPQIIPVINNLFGKFERIAAELNEESSPAHRNYIQRNLHEIVLCAPFANRTYHKPLGYPGDYEMVNMMARDPQEGNSLFAKIFNVWLLQQGSAMAHRNRLTELLRLIESEALRASRKGSKARIFNFACGPAIEVQRFIENSLLSEQVEFTLSDFNNETLEHTSQAINKIREQAGRRTSVQFQKKAVHQLFKESQKQLASGNGGMRLYDFIYCAGLFDYLTDQACKQLIKIFHQWLAPGGLLLVTNVTPLTPNRGSLELILDWHLIYRNAAQFAQLCSGIIPKEMIRVRSDDTGVNIFLEARKLNDNGK